MWYFLIKAVPRLGSSETNTSGGAYVNCWINFQLEDGAKYLAGFYLSQEGWIPEAVEESSWVERETYEDNHDGLRHFSEAEHEGACFVINTYPTNGEDSEG